MKPEIVVGRPSEGEFDTRLLHALYRFRHRVFRQRLGWEVSSIGGMEFDFYDEIDPMHVAACLPGNRVIASSRLLPTVGPYMLRDVFPQLLRGESAPCASDVWEVSRFAVEPPERDARVQATCNEATLALLDTGFQVAQEHGVREFVMATSVAVERMLVGAGLHMERFGDGVATRIGKVLSVACRVEVTESQMERMYARVAQRFEEQQQMAGVA